MKILKKLKILFPLQDLPKCQKGFSLMEILIALALLAIVGTYATTKFMDMFEEGKQDSARIQMQTLAGRLQDFRRHCNFYPTTDQGLDALLNKPSSGRPCAKYRSSGYLDNEEMLTDPWETELGYESDGRKFQIISYYKNKNTFGIF